MNNVKTIYIVQDLKNYVAQLSKKIRIKTLELPNVNIVL